jgi:hypothetical protein
MSAPGRIGGLLSFAVVAVVVLSGQEVTAQEDFRSLDQGRPLKVTDAFPKKYLEWEFQFGLQGGWAEEGANALGGNFVLEAGLFRNFEIGAGLQLARENDGASTTSGLESLQIQGLYNFKHEGWTWPAVAIQAGVEAPGGSDLSREDWGWGADLLLTRSFANLLRIHVNAGYAIASDVDRGDYWRGGVALDIPMGFSSRLIMGDLYAEIPAGTGQTRTWAELGTRIQVSNLTVIDMGLATRLDEWNDGRANIQLVVGVSRVFGIGGLVRVPEYPNPRIR